MKCQFLLVLICLLLLTSLAGICAGEESTSDIIYIQGGESSISNGSDGMMMITVQDVVPYVHISYDEKSYLIPVEYISGFTSPLNAALVLSNPDSEFISLVEISNLSLSDGNTSLILQGKPLEFYEGMKLKSLTGENIEWDKEKTGTYSSIGIYIETTQLPPENDVRTKYIFRSMNPDIPPIFVFGKDITPTDP